MSLREQRVEEHLLHFDNLRTIQLQNLTTWADLEKVFDERWFQFEDFNPKVSIVWLRKSSEKMCSPRESSPKVSAWKFLITLTLSTMFSEHLQRSVESKIRTTRFKPAKWFPHALCTSSGELSSSDFPCSISFLCHINASLFHHSGS